MTIPGVAKQRQHVALGLSGWCRDRSLEHRFEKRSDGTDLVLVYLGEGIERQCVELTFTGVLKGNTPTYWTDQLRTKLETLGWVDPKKDDNMDGINSPVELFPARKKNIPCAMLVGKDNVEVVIPPAPEGWKPRMHAGETARLRDVSCFRARQLGATPSDIQQALDSAGWVGRRASHSVSAGKKIVQGPTEPSQPEFQVPLSTAADMVNDLLEEFRPIMLRRLEEMFEKAAKFERVQEALK